MVGSGEDQTLFTVFPICLFAALVDLRFPKLSGKVADKERVAAWHKVRGREEVEAVHDATDVGT